MKTKALLNSIEHGSFMKDGKLIEWNKALVTFEGCSPCFIKCKTLRPLDAYKIGEVVEIDIELKAYKMEPLIKYTIH